MNSDLQQARASLGAGRRDEALVYAWNALTSASAGELVELRRLAEELEDASLLRELDQRGVPAVPVTSPAPPPSAKRTRGALIGTFVFAGVVLAILAVAVSQIPTEGGPVHASPKDTVEFTTVRRILTVGPGVYLVPLGDVHRVDVRALAEEVGGRYHVPTRTLPPVALPVWTLDTGERALNGDQLIRLLQLTYPTRGRTAVIGLTDYDMFSPSLRMHGLFSLRNPLPYGVVSSSPLGASLFDRLRGHGRYERVRKLVARNIGFLYLRRSQSPDPHSLLRNSMTSVHDIDALDEDLHTARSR
jgi:hypothetical protein